MGVGGRAGRVLAADTAGFVVVVLVLVDVEMGLWWLRWVLEVGFFLDGGGGRSGGGGGGEE